jgi:hypothetical protein
MAFSKKQIFMALFKEKNTTFIAGFKTIFLQNVI